jgi:hypothetical protein
MAGRKIAENSLSCKNFSQGPKMFDRLKYQHEADNVTQSKGSPKFDRTKDIARMKYEFHLCDVTASNSAGWMIIFAIL